MFCRHVFGNISGGFRGISCFWGISRDFAETPKFRGPREISEALNKISLDWPRTLTTQLSTSKLSDNPERVKIIGRRNEVRYCAVCYFVR